MIIMNFIQNWKSESKDEKDITSLPAHWIMTWDM